MYDCHRIAAQRCGLAINFANRRCIGDRAESIRDAVWDEVGLTTLRLQFVDQRANSCIAVIGPTDIMQLRSEEPVEKSVT